ncbi:MAG: ABC transporter permease [Lachnospiraceae bacterium]|nr:ABC transporter permease [Lachnospiraceae bacterium]
MASLNNSLLLSLPRSICQNRRLIAKLAKNDFKTRYAGSYLGIIWAFIQPIVTVLVYWLVFGLGFKSASQADVPFVLYLTCGIVPWFYCQELLLSGTNVLLEYSYLVKKVVFEIGVLPVVKAASAFFVHAFFVLVAIVIGMLYGIYPSVYLLQLVYYFAALVLFILGLVYATSAIVIFFRDLTQIISITLQIGIWSVPIMFVLQSFETKSWVWIFRINPMYYIITGYRDAIYGHVWFWERGWYTLYYWGWTAAVLLLGSVIFRKLKPHFADVL